MKDIYKAPCVEVEELEIESVCLSDSSTEVSKSYDIESGDIEDINW